jgi:HK97 family phage major capsid protein
MSLQIALNSKRDKLGQEITSIRALGKKIAEATEKGETTSEMEAQFDRHMAAVTDLKVSVQKLESGIEMERDNDKLVNALEAQAREKHNSGGRETVTARAGADNREVHAKAFNLYLRGRDGEMADYLVDKMSATERHALLGTSGQLGGFLSPEDFRAEVIKNMSGFVVMRNSGCRVVPTSGSVLVFPSISGGTDPYSTGVEGSWRAEGSQGTDGTAPATQDKPTFGQERIPIHVWQPSAVVITRELLDDSVVPLESIVAQAIAETKAQDEDYAFLRGDGQGRPRGLVDYVAASAGPAITAVNSGSAANHTYNGLIDLMMALPAQYRQASVFYTRSTGWGDILKLKDSSNQPIIYANSVPDTLFGKKVFISEHMPAVSANQYPTIFGDPRFYCIAERSDMRIQRLEERFAPNIGLLPTARLGGGVLRTDAFRAQKMSV